MSIVLSSVILPANTSSFNDEDFELISSDLQSSDSAQLAFLVYDTKSGIYDRLLFFSSVYDAARAFRVLMNNPETLYYNDRDSYRHVYAFSFNSKHGAVYYDKKYSFYSYLLNELESIYFRPASSAPSPVSKHES